MGRGLSMATGLRSPRIPWRRMLASQGAARAFIETLAVGALLALILSYFYGHINNGIYTDYFVYLTILSVALYAYRLRIVVGDWEHRFLFDVIFGLVVGVAVGLIVLQFVYWFTPDSYGRELWDYRAGIALEPFSARWELNIVIAPP